MLKKFPEQALRFAVDGVIPPSALGQARHAQQLEHYARRRAGAMMAPLPGQIAQAKKDARLTGYTHGYADAIAEVVPHLAALLADVHSLRDGLRQQLCNVLTRSLQAEGVHAELIVQRCAQQLASPDPILLFLPEQDLLLRQALQARLQALPGADAVQLRSTDGPHALLKVGSRVLELDPVGPLLVALDDELDVAALEEEARRRAQAYVDSFTPRARPAAAHPSGHKEPVHAPR
ncbi:TPA: hypothetical protein QEL15_003915 [Stenotrophomonas maltophilia]|nr:hypothetical protein [Stenotrophomonas maltophilia]